MQTAQSFYTLVYYEVKLKLWWKSFFGCGKVRGKRAKLQQNREGNPLFHGFEGWKSGKYKRILLKCRKWMV